MGTTHFSGPVYSAAGFITGPDAYVPVTAQLVTLGPADNGLTQTINYAGAGGIVTLPPAIADNVGLAYNFSFAANVANPYKIKTATSTPGDLFVGSVYTAASGGAATLFVPNGTTNDVMNLGGAAGGQLGSTLSVVCTAVGKWTVSGNLIASAAPTTPFADS